VGSAAASRSMVHLEVDPRYSEDHRVIGGMCWNVRGLSLLRMLAEYPRASTLRPGYVGEILCHSTGKFQMPLPSGLTASGRVELNGSDATAGMSRSKSPRG
jgi:hypothetical protein